MKKLSEETNLWDVADNDHTHNFAGLINKDLANAL